MSSESNIAISFSNDINRDYVIIEQEPWGKDVGRTSDVQGITAIGSMIFGGSLPLPDCGGLAEFNTLVYVYPSRPDLYFTFHVSHGNFLPGKIESNLLREEVIQCRFKISQETDYPVNGIRFMKWIGKCYNAKGEIVPYPSISIDGRIFTFSEKVYGSLRVRYSVFRYTYKVRITERDDSIENNFECIAFCTGYGDVVYKEIQAPSGFGDSLGNCGNGIYPLGLGTESEIEICTPDWGQGVYPVAVRADKLTRVDYCSQEIMDERVTESIDTENEPGEECSDGPITTN